MSELKVILLCSSRFAIPAMQELVFFKQLAIVAVPRNRPEMVENVRSVLTGLDIPILELDKASFAKELTRAIQKYKVTVGIMMTFGYIIPASVFNLPEKGFYNVHPGPLPGYRGADPIFRQIKNKEPNAGVTIHKLDEGLDTGPVVLRQMMKLEKTDTYGILTSKLAQLAAGMVRVLLKLATFDLSIPSKPQDESKAVYYKKQAAKDITINWQQMDASDIIALINACNPWNKGAVTKFNNRIIRMVEAEKLKDITSNNYPAGTVTGMGERSIDVSTLNGCIIKIHIIYVDEGFLNAASLVQVGVTPGCRFE